jgi:hypothetical protein
VLTVLVMWMVAGSVFLLVSWGFALIVRRVDNFFDGFLFGMIRF